MRAARYSWIVIGLLFFITIVNYVDRSAISYAGSDISRAFNLNQDSIGLILDAFGIGYLLTTFLGGIWTDRRGAHNTLVIACLLWSIAIGATGCAVLFGAGCCLASPRAPIPRS